MNQTHFTEITSQPSKHTKGREGNASTTEMIQHQGTFCTTWVNCWIHTAYAEVAGMSVCVCVCVCVHAHMYLYVFRWCMCFLICVTEQPCTLLTEKNV